MTIPFLNNRTQWTRFVIILSSMVLTFSTNISTAMDQSQGAKSKKSAVSNVNKSPSGSTSNKGTSQNLPTKTKSPSAKPQAKPKNAKSASKPKPSAEKIPNPSPKPLNADQTLPINKPMGVGSNLTPETAKKTRADKLSKSETKIEKNKNREPSLSEGETAGSTIWVWLIPVAFFTAAGGLYLFQRFQHLLVHQIKEFSPKEEIRPESRAEVAFGSVLASLDLDSPRSEDSGSKAGVKLDDKRGKTKNFQESIQSSKHKEPLEEDKTKVSGPKPKTLNPQNQIYHATLLSEKSTMPKSGEAIAINATLEPEPSSAVDFKAASAGSINNEGSAFLTAPPSAMNWINPFNNEQDPANDPNIKLKESSGYQKSVGKISNKDPK